MENWEKKDLLKELENFSGTYDYYLSTFKKLKLTDGVNYLRNKVDCYWLIDIVESVQHLKKIKENNEFILWKIEVDKDKKAIVKALTDSGGVGKLLYEQKLEYTDFPLDEFEFYQEGDVLLLKGEH